MTPAGLVATQQYVFVVYNVDQEFQKTGAETAPVTW